MYVLVVFVVILSFLFFESGSSKFCSFVCVLDVYGFLESVCFYNWLFEYVYCLSVVRFIQLYGLRLGLYCGDDYFQGDFEGCNESMVVCVVQFQFCLIIEII